MNIAAGLGTWSSVLISGVSGTMVLTLVNILAKYINQGFIKCSLNLKIPLVAVATKLSLCTKNVARWLAPGLMSYTSLVLAADQNCKKFSLGTLLF